MKHAVSVSLSTSAHFYHEIYKDNVDTKQLYYEINYMSSEWKISFFKHVNVCGISFCV